MLYTPLLPLELIVFSTPSACAYMPTETRTLGFPNAYPQRTTI